MDKNLIISIALAAVCLLAIGISIGILIGLNLKKGKIQDLESDKARLLDEQKGLKEEIRRLLPYQADAQTAKACFEESELLRNWISISGENPDEVIRRMRKQAEKEAAEAA